MYHVCVVVVHYYRSVELVVLVFVGFAAVGFGYVVYAMGQY